MENNMNTRLSTITICLAACLTIVATQGEARLRGSSRTAAPAPAPVAVPAVVPVQAQAASSLPAAGYPAGLGWRAVENDFIDVKARIDVVEGKLDAVKADTESILIDTGNILTDTGNILTDTGNILTDTGNILTDTGDILTELDDVDADHLIIMDKLDALDAELGNVAGDVLSVADDVAALKNTMQVQVSIESKSASDRNEVNDAPVSLFVQVTQNGVGVVGLTSDSFVFSNSFPTDGAGYCGTDACFIPGMDGIYKIELVGDWVAGAYAGTLIAQDGSTTATGTSIVTFEIPAEPAAP
jgi:hypothetical protein